MIDFHNEPWGDAEKRETVERLLEKFAAVLPDVPVAGGLAGVVERGLHAVVDEVEGRAASGATKPSSDIVMLKNTFVAIRGARGQSRL